VHSFREEDKAGVRDLWQEVFPQAPAWNEPAADIRRKLGVQPELFLVGLVNGRVVATVMAGFDGHRGWVYYLATSPSLRRRGIGRTMMAEAEARLRALGCPKINLQVRASNPEVVAFYEKLGFQVEERVSMGKRLGPRE
jgi:ribosomal protein S18 acetylase RimI-like enzyme